MMPIKDPSESVVVEFDFGGELSTITSATVAASVQSGTADPNPSAILYGGVQLDGNKVLQRISGGVSGTTYKLRCEATDGLDVILRADLLPVKSLP